MKYSATASSFPKPIRMEHQSVQDLGPQPFNQQRKEQGVRNSSKAPLLVSFSRNSERYCTGLHINERFSAGGCRMVAVLKTSKNDKPLLYSVIEIQPSRELGETEEKGLSNFLESPIFIGRDDWIRTSDLSHPKRTRGLFIHCQNRSKHLKINTLRELLVLP